MNEEEKKAVQKCAQSKGGAFESNSLLIRYKILSGPHFTSDFSRLEKMYVIHYELTMHNVISVIFKINQVL